MPIWSDSSGSTTMDKWPMHTHMYKSTVISVIYDFSGVASEYEMTF